MRLRTFLLFFAFAFSMSADAQVSIPHSHRFDHPGDLGQQERNAQSDFFMAKFFLAQCRVNLARTWLSYARRHDPANPEFVIAETQFEEWRKSESLRVFGRARAWRSTDLSEYYYALSCDPDNAEIAKEIAVILSDRNPPSERKLR
jgi:hypothetical protein